MSELGMVCEVYKWETLQRCLINDHKVGKLHRQGPQFSRSEVRCGVFHEPGVSSMCS